MELVSIYMARTHDVDLESDDEAQPMAQGMAQTVAQPGHVRKPHPADFVKPKTGKQKGGKRARLGRHAYEQEKAKQ
tara:strand:+ start:253 stop:480 length:228 start_codon:yes stop_codon:yes gene_type:complete